MRKRSPYKAKNSKIDLVLGKLDQVFEKLNDHDQRFDGIDQRLNGHDEEFESINKKLERMIEKSIDHDLKLANTVTKTDFKIFEHRVFDLLDQGAEQLDRLDKEQACMKEGLARVEHDVIKIKRHLQLVA